MLDGGVLVSDGALGRGAPVSVLEGAVPAPVAGLSKVTQISVGPNLGSCARTSDGAVYCWGRNDFGQLGRPPAEPRLPVPMRIEGLPPVDEVKLGYRAGCAIASSDRAVYCWGSRGSSGFAPPAVEAAFRPPVKSLAIGNWGSANDTIIGLLEGNILSTIGDHGIRGESIVNKTEKANVSWIGPYAYATTEGLFRRWAPIDESLYVPSIAPIIDVKISGETSNSNSVQGGALTVRGRLFRWGPNATGALGRHPYELTAAAYPVEVQQVREKVVSFATTVVSTCASLVDGTVQCWGGNASGELGRGTVDFDPHPEPEVIVR